MWKIFKFSIYEKFLSIKQLVIHFSRKQLIYFEENVIRKKLEKKINKA